MALAEDSPILKPVYGGMSNQVAPTNIRGPKSVRGTVPQGPDRHKAKKPARKNLILEGLRGARA